MRGLGTLLVLVAVLAYQGALTALARRPGPGHERQPPRRDSHPWKTNLDNAR